MLYEKRERVLKNWKWNK